MPFPPDLLDEVRADLERQLARLERSMSITEDAARPVELDQQAVGRLSRMDALQNQSMSENLRAREAARYAAIRAALKRMDRGAYGICTGCGGEIAAGRLMVIPEIEHCPACAA